MTCNEYHCEYCNKKLSMEETWSWWKYLRWIFVKRSGRSSNELVPKDQNSNTFLFYQWHALDIILLSFPQNNLHKRSKAIFAKLRGVTDLKWSQTRLNFLTNDFKKLFLCCATIYSKHLSTKQKEIETKLSFFLFREWKGGKARPRFARAPLGARPLCIF